MTTDEAGRYFATDPSLEPDGKGRYVTLDRVSPVEFVRGLEFRPVQGERLLVNFVHFEPHTEAPLHAHEEEQVTVVIDGEFEFDLDGDVRTMRRGTVAHIPPGVPHAARTRETSCFEIDIFSPPRRALLEMIGGAEGGGEAAPSGGPTPSGDG